MLARPGPFPQMTAFNRTLAPVLNARGAVIAIFALTMIVPLAVAMLAGERAQPTKNWLSCATGVVMCTATRPFNRELPPPANGVDLIAEMAAIFARFDNIGPALNGVGPAANYVVLKNFETWVCTFAMLIGRLELMSVLALFTPAYWRN